MHHARTATRVHAGRVGDAEKAVAEYRNEAPTVMKEIDQYPNEYWANAIDASANALEGLVYICLYWRLYIRTGTGTVHIYVCSTVDSTRM